GWRRLALLAGCFTAGTLLALPQLVEFLRILPLSFRGQKGYEPQVATLASWDPYQVAEWFLPMIFGRLDMLSLASFWGKKFFTGVPPYYVTLYPGLLTLALVLASGRPRRRAAWWAWGAVVFGLFFSLGRFNPAAEWVFTLRNGALRYPVKLWLPLAVGAALLCGLCFQRLLGPADDPLTRRARRRFGLALLGLFLVLGGFWAFLTFQPGTAEELASRIIPKAFQTEQPFVRNERLRWAGLCLFSFAVLAGLAAGARLLRRRPALGGAVILAVHAVSQVLLLRPAYPTDPIQPYLIPPPALDYVPADVRVVNPDLNSLFGKHTLRDGKFPERKGNWLERRAFYELYSFTGPQWGRRYDLNVSPEGLDTYLARMAQGAVRGSNDTQRIRMLAAWGVGRLLMNHPLTPDTPGVRELAAIPSFGFHLYIYEVLDRAPEVFLAHRAVFAPHMNAAYRTLSGAMGGVSSFNARRDVVLPGNGKPEALGGGTVRIVKDEPEELEVEADVGPGGSVLVVQRSALLQKATVDGRPAEVLNANLQRAGIRVPAGRHRVRLWIDRRPFELSLGGTALGLLLLPVLFWWGRRPAGRDPLL
ncbi:MAG TPA: hypothetical protein VEL74_00160, partial [Thermoanaerobaculia bacterium]|nr:hypothetical protein [Thermoanaerobaculia bacterium]